MPFRQTPSQLRLFRDYNGKILAGTAELRRLTTENPRQQYRLGELETLCAQYVTQLEKIAISRAPRTVVPLEEAAAIRGLDSQQFQLDALVQSMVDDEKALLGDRLDAANRWFNRNVVILGLTFGAVVILLAYNFRLLTREISHTREMERTQLENIRSSRALSGWPVNYMIASVSISLV